MTHCPYCELPDNPHVGFALGASYGCALRDESMLVLMLLMCDVHREDFKKSIVQAVDYLKKIDEALKAFN